jgi:hypothetical protein
MEAIPVKFFLFSPDGILTISSRWDRNDFPGTKQKYRARIAGNSRAIVDRIIPIRVTPCDEWEFSLGSKGFSSQ